MTTVQDIMTTKLATLPESASIQEAARMMRDRDTGNVLVVDGSDRMIGLLTDRDIVVRCLAEGSDLSSVTVGDVCTSQVQSLPPSADVQEAIQMVRDNAIRRVPVVDGDRPVGIISIGDLAVERDSSSALADISAASPNH